MTRLRMFLIVAPTISLVVFAAISVSATDYPYIAAMKHDEPSAACLSAVSTALHSVFPGADLSVARRWQCRQFTPQVGGGPKKVLSAVTK